MKRREFVGAGLALAATVPFRGWTAILKDPGDVAAKSLEGADLNLPGSAVADFAAGLRGEEAAQRLGHCGENRLVEAKARPLLLKFLDQFRNLLVLVHGVMASLHPDFVVLKLAPADGATIWQANWGTNAGDHPRDLDLDVSGDVYVTGTVLHGGDAYGTVKLRGGDGSLIWEAWDAAGHHLGAAALAVDGAGV